MHIKNIEVTHFTSRSVSPLGCCFTEMERQRNERQISQKAREGCDQKTRAGRGKVRLG